jgi:predicted DNA-binding protein (MmcQ/YjbR family)
VLLDCPANPDLRVPDDQLAELIDASWQLTATKRRRARKTVGEG